MGFVIEVHLLDLLYDTSPRVPVCMLVPAFSTFWIDKSSIPGRQSLHQTDLVSVDTSHGRQ